jgi:hypothetical protein
MTYAQLQAYMYFDSIRKASSLTIGASPASVAYTTWPAQIKQRSSGLKSRCSHIGPLSFPYCFFSITSIYLPFLSLGVLEVLLVCNLQCLRIPWLIRVHDLIVMHNFTVSPIFRMLVRMDLFRVFLEMSYRKNSMQWGN